ncbi:right-handed parallel beta-helix repeat-containing protein [Benzoatithermus flavus]|uniref:Right-handed parallel beta-helix repeat-containing protein n=1 Tax=Benzoatithermus flavus TaxID=3108223 RepID=A0ABU8XQ72_9PROT
MLHDTLMARARAGEHVLILPPGTFRLQVPLVFDKSFSGTDEAPVVIRGAPEGSTLSGGRPVGDWRNVGDDGVAVDPRLPAVSRPYVRIAGLPPEAFPALPPEMPRGFGRSPVDPPPLLYFRGEPMPQARWPDAGYLRITSLPEGEQGRIFGFTEPPPAGLGLESDPWLSGYWYHDYADERVPAAAIDVGQRTIRLGPIPLHYGMRVGQRFAVENALSALDRPGEWYLDRERRLLYFWPPAPIAEGDVELAWAPVLLRIEGARHLRIEGVRLERARTNAVLMQDVDDVILRDCEIRGTGANAVTVAGTRSGLERCSIRSVGAAGVVLSGGDRQTLSPAANFVRDSEIADFARLTRTYAPGIVMDGVGQIASRNRIHGAPHSGIRFAGNDHVIEGNLLYDLMHETGDAGAIYTGRDWTARGTLIRDNTLCNLYSPFPGGAKGVYLDDLASGISIMDNRFHNVQDAIFIGGGSDNIVARNIVVGGQRPITLDARGLTWAKDKLFAPRPSGWDMRARLEQVPWSQEPYASRYPALLLIFGDEPGVPKRNIIDSNRLLGTKVMQLDKLVIDRQLVINNTEGSHSEFEMGQLFPTVCLDSAGYAELTTR